MNSGELYMNERKRKVSLQKVPSSDIYFNTEDTENREQKQRPYLFLKRGGDCSMLLNLFGISLE